MVSPGGDRCAAMPSILSMLSASVASSNVSPVIRAPLLISLGLDAAYAHLYSLAVTEAAFEHDEPAIWQRGGVGDVKASNAFEGEWSGGRPPMSQP